jgi:hypothetical protein
VLAIIASVKAPLEVCICSFSDSIIVLSLFCLAIIVAAPFTTCILTRQPFHDFLVAKQMSNVTPATFHERFPGLVHFIYVNRRSEAMVAPALMPYSCETILFCFASLIYLFLRASC